MPRSGSRARRRRLAALSAFSACIAFGPLAAVGSTPPVEWEDPAPRPAGASRPAPRERTPTPPAGRASSLLLELDAALAREPDGGERPMASALVRAALAIREPGLPLDASTLEGLSEPDRRLVESFHDACRRIGRDLEDGKPAGEALLALDPVLTLASEGPPLVIPRVELCSRVDSHGKYVPLPSRNFTAGKVTPVLLYTELVGFTSGAVAGRWRTDVASRAILLSKDDGSIAWSREWLPLRDESDRPREDFFLSERIDLPATLAPGRYVLKSTVRDEATGRIAERSVPIEIAAPERTATAGD
jgi:hypothetical protein